MPERYKKIQFDKSTDLEKALFWAKVFAKEISDAVIILNTANQMIWWNPIAQELFGLDENEHRDHAITNVIRQTSFVQYVEERKGGTLELPSPVNPNMMLSVVLIPSGSLILLVAQDISHKHHIDRMRQDFVANVSHEMRTPLTVLQGYLEMMSIEVPEVLPHWQESIGEMQGQMTRLESLLEELLLLAKLEGSDIGDQSVVDVPTMIHSLLSDSQKLSGEAHQFIVEIEPLLIKGHEKELRSCFGNLLTNAVRYSPDGGVIRIQWKQDSKGLYFSVEDQGIGISEKHIPRLTERFYRVDKGRSRETGGTGLGLSIVKHVLMRHQAKLKAESQLGKGSKFTCVFSPSKKV